MWTAVEISFPKDTPRNPKYYLKIIILTNIQLDLEKELATKSFSFFFFLTWDTRQSSLGAKKGSELIKSTKEQLSIFLKTWDKYLWTRHYEPYSSI